MNKLQKQPLKMEIIIRCSQKPIIERHPGL